MARTGSTIEVPGFDAEQFDFPALLADLPGAQDFLGSEFLDPLFDAEGADGFGTSCEQRRYCSVLIIGHSDRNDEPGLTSEERRAKELQFSELRAQSAAAWLLSQLQDRLQNQGITFPADWPSGVNVGLELVSAGAADLKFTTPANESERKENRRVAFTIAVFSLS
jgi:hypothetical protein